MRQLDYISLIHKELTGAITLEESKVLSAWLKSSRENLETLEDVRAVWEATEAFEPNFVPDVNKAFQKQLERINSEQERLPKIVRMKPAIWVRAIAASIVFLLSALVIWNTYSPEKIIATDEIVNVTLEDGTSIWLNKGSTLTLDNSFASNNRSVTLDGEAYFDVARDEKLPFTIQAGDFNVEVLGTAFNVRSNDLATSSVAVERGTVKVTANNTPEILTKGEYAIISQEEGVVKTTLTDQNEFSWKENKLMFSDAPMANVIEDIASFYNVNIEMNQTNVDCPFSITEPISVDLTTIMKLLEVSNGVMHTTDESGKIIITSISCD